MLLLWWKRTSCAPNFQGGKTHEWHRPLGQFQCTQLGSRTVPRVIGPFQPDLSLCWLADSEDWSGRIKRWFDWCWSPLLGTGLTPCNMLSSAVGQGLRGHGWINPSCVWVLLPEKLNEKKKKKKAGVNLMTSEEGTSASNRKHWRNLG